MNTHQVPDLAHDLSAIGLALSIKAIRYCVFTVKRRVSIIQFRVIQA